MSTPTPTPTLNPLEQAAMDAARALQASVAVPTGVTCFGLAIFTGEKFMPFSVSGCMGGAGVCETFSDNTLTGALEKMGRVTANAGKLRAQAAAMLARADALEGKSP